MTGAKPRHLICMFDEEDMEEEDGNLPQEIQTRAIDYVSSAARAALGAVPFVGSLLVEIAGTIIPKQRVDRIADFAAKLDARIGNLEKSGIGVQMRDEEFTDLVEEALRQAARSTSEERRNYLASLVANSLSSESIKHAESKHLMRFLDELNDVEVLWLRFFYDPTIGGDEEFRNIHKDVFRPRSAHIGSSVEEIDANALQESYKDHLIRLGLVQEHFAMGRDGKPQFDKITGGFKKSYRETTLLGRLLLGSIGIVPNKCRTGR